MINGEEEIHQASSSEVASPDPLEEFVPWKGPESDGGDESPVYSQYSSCGDSEFDRYCSANSVMGTPSLCSSVEKFQDCGDSDFGSVKSYGIGYVGSLDNFSLGDGLAGKLEEKRLSLPGGSGCLSDSGIESSEGKSNMEGRNDVELRQKLTGASNYPQCQLSQADIGDMESSNAKNESKLLRPVSLNSALDGGLCSEDDEGGVVQWRNQGEPAAAQTCTRSVPTQENTCGETTGENMLKLQMGSDSHSSADIDAVPHRQIDIERMEGHFEGLRSHSCSGFDGGEVARYSDQDTVSSRCEHSEGEESMFGYGTDDDEQQMNLYQGRDVRYFQEAKNGKKDSLLMSSSIAFGSDDWNDFVQERGDSDIVSIKFEKVMEQKQPYTEADRGFPSETDIGFLGVGLQHGRVVSIIAQPGNPVQDVGFRIPDDFPRFGEAEGEENVEDVPVNNNQVRNANESAEYCRTISPCIVSDREQDLLSKEAPPRKGLNFMDGNSERTPVSSTKTNTIFYQSASSENEDLKTPKLQLDPLSSIKASLLCSTEAIESQMVDLPVEAYPLPITVENNREKYPKDSSVLLNLCDKHPKNVKTENLDSSELYNDVVHEMEEILLDSTESPGASFASGGTTYKSLLPLSLRDGGSTASTSGNDDAYPQMQRPLRLDGVEVVGAKQKKGDVSFSERLVGVKEYTVYIIRAWSGRDHWEVERRYRDFCTLYCRLKTTFSDQGWVLPSPWSSVERESRKIFGNVSPDVVAERSDLIQECLQSILYLRFTYGLPNALIWFLSPPESLPSSPASNACYQNPPFSVGDAKMDNVSVLGKTISLIVEIQPQKSVKQILEAQHYTCAGCHKHFDVGKTRMLEFVQTLGWRKPRLCEYTRQLFCSSCHTNETAVLPARVLHYWDFTQYPVSQLAKSYLDSICNQPMLCVSAVNPSLFSKVPALHQVTVIRKKIGAMITYVRCPFQASIYKGLGARRYLLESNDFFALRDLTDLSKGAFAALPVLVETVSRKMREHIMEQCLICCDVGVPCNARHACSDPSSLIFPFQEGEIERCRSCESVFHTHCFKRINGCPCGVVLRPDEDAAGSTVLSRRAGSESSSTLDLFGKSASKSTMGLFSGLFSKARPENSWGSKDCDTVILMGSLPNSSL